MHRRSSTVVHKTRAELGTKNKTAAPELICQTTMAEEIFYRLQLPSKSNQVGGGRGQGVGSERAFGL